MRAFLIVLVLCSALPSRSTAQCALEGVGVVDAVTPDGTSLSLGVSEQVRVSIAGARAHVVGVTPIAFEGEARSRDVRVALIASHTFFGVLRAAAAVPVQVTRASRRGATLRIAAGPTALVVTLPCDEVGLSEIGSTPDVEDLEDMAEQMRVAGRVLRVYSHARGGRPVALRDGREGERFGYLDVVERRGARVHVRAVLGSLVLDGWVERENLRPLPEVISGCGCDTRSSSFGCGHGYGGETERGRVTLAAGTELSDGDGVVWGHLVADAMADVVVTVPGVAVSIGPDGTRTETRHPIVYVESLTGLLTPPCDGLGVHVPRADVVLPTDGGH